MGDHTGNFGTVEGLIKVERLEECERGMFPGKNTISRKAKELKNMWVASFHKISTGHLLGTGISSSSMKICCVVY